MWLPALSKFLSVSPTHFVYIWWKWKCCNWNSNIIELSMTSPPWYLHIKNPAILSPTDNFLDQTPLWPWWLLHNPTSVIDICQILYAYHAIKGNLSYVCSPASRCSNLPVFQQLSASFAPVTGLCWFTELPQIHQRSTVYLQKPSISERVFAHISRGKESDVTGSESKVYSTKPDFWSCYTTRGNTLRWLCLHNTGFTHSLLFLPDLKGILTLMSMVSCSQLA